MREIYTKLGRYLERAIAILLATIVAACVGSGFSDNPTTWKTYYGTPDDYVFDHPIGWQTFQFGRNKDGYMAYTFKFARPKGGGISMGAWNPALHRATECELNLRPLPEHSPDADMAALLGKWFEFEIAKSAQTSEPAQYLPHTGHENHLVRIEMQHMRAGTEKRTISGFTTERRTSIDWLASFNAWRIDDAIALLVCQGEPHNKAKFHVLANALETTLRPWR